ncbi:sodium/glutamate symporter [Ramlibacter sp. USB13]|uniref:Sodium/glutamate symporter n=1 Tax=Ramlibacter cellulosilyticus TaxID=2764187 RepID=A0A923MQ41_9BURK|nr:sodium/glutamate symporter [Ramlibacter cellulosilyticus]MBC5782504.1 sodium/glutamate symporter [Ramlibacter cellulosilyticus]
MNLDPLLSLFTALLVLLVGTFLNRRIGLLARYNIPDPITGGVLFAAVASAIAAAGGGRLVIDQTLKPLLLLLFFAGVGMGADLRALGRGGKALAIFLVVLFPFILLQNAVGIAGAWGLDLHPIFGLVAGSITLVGGHGTGAAYAARFADGHNLQSVMDLSMTVATLGLIIGGIIAGPVAQYLIGRDSLRSEAAQEAAAEGDRVEAGHITTVGAVGALAGMIAAVLAGQWLSARFSGGAITIPAFLWCMVLGVAIRNLGPFVRLRFDDRASELIAGVCLSLFLVTTMMALDLVEVALAAGPLLVILLLQIVCIVFFAITVCYRFLGRDYEAAVTTAAFIGFSMGSTATAMANMQAITTRYGPAPQSYLIVPLAGAFFIDLMNAFLLTLILALPFVGG